MFFFAAAFLAAALFVEDDVALYDRPSLSVMQPISLNSLAAAHLHNRSLLLLLRLVPTADVGSANTPSTALLLRRYPPIITALIILLPGAT